jgi:uroporphyrin-3 C-methyltransferase
MDMSNDNEKEKEGVVIDVTPDTEDNETEEATQPTDEQGSKKSAFNPALLLSVLVLLGLLIAAFMAYRYTQQATQDLSAMNERLSQAINAQQQMQKHLGEAQKLVQAQQTQLDKQQQDSAQQKENLALAKEQFSRQEDLLNSERQNMQEREAELRASVADVHRRVGASGTQWIVAEAEYLLRIANHRLSLARDIGTAKNALTLADQRLHDTKDPTWNPIREQIAREFSALDSIGLPDTTGISAKLAAAAEQVPQLKLARATIGVQPSRLPSGETATQERTWETLLDDLWAGFTSTVRIRRNDQPVKAMLPPEQQFFLYENLRLHLEAARLAVARADAMLYRDNLSQATNALQRYFDHADATSKAMLKTVRELHKLDIRPPLPDISQSLRILQTRKQLNQQLQQPLPGSEQ